MPISPLRSLIRLFGVFLLLFVCAIGFPGCGTFHREWAAAARGADRAPFGGQWQGVWRSEKHPGEGGKLRCVFSRIDDRRYRAHFEAHWKVFTSGYVAEFNVRRSGRELRFEGQHELPAIFGGIYTYQGRVSPKDFTAQYDSRYDRGVFQMSRP